MMKKRFMTLAMAGLLATSAFAFGGCKPEEDKNEQVPQKVMNVSLNPEVEFILDKNDTVVTVNALNEEGNLIISAGAFTGKSAEEAAKLFVQISKDTGFLVSGNASYGDNEIEFSFSGDVKEAQKLYNSVKSEVENYLGAENITAQIEKIEAITEEELRELVEECAPYIEDAKLQALGYMELLEELYESREETVNFYSQELKNAYYEAKAFAMEQAELETLRTHLSTAEGILFDAAYIGYSTAVNAIESTRQILLVDENSVYQTALAAFRTAKTNYLNYRNEVAAMEQTEVTEAILAKLAVYETKLDAAEAKLEEISETANKRLDDLKDEVQTAYDGVVDCLGKWFSKANEYVEEISAKQKEAQTKFFADFEKGYKNGVESSKKAWEDMKNNLQSGTITDNEENA